MSNLLTNETLALRVIDKIRDDPDHFDMSWWVTQRNPDGISSYMLALNDGTRHKGARTLVPDCGTSARIAGWAVLLTPIDDRQGFESMQEAGEKLLGLDPETADLLFGTSGWPAEARHMTREDGAIWLLEQLIADNDPFFRERCEPGDEE